MAAPFARYSSFGSGFMLQKTAFMIEQSPTTRKGSNSLARVLISRDMEEKKTKAVILTKIQTSES